jgi:hypothetical protein
MSSIEYRPPLIERLAWSIAIGWPIIMLMAWYAAYLAGCDALLSAWALLIGSSLLLFLGAMCRALYVVWRH